MNARLSLCLSELRGKEVYRRERRKIYIQLFSSRVGNDNNCQQSTINNQVGKVGLFPLHSSHLDEVRNLRTVNKAPAYEEAKAGSGNTKVHLLEKGNPGKWGMENHWR